MTETGTLKKATVEDRDRREQVVRFVVSLATSLPIQPRKDCAE